MKISGLVLALACHQAVGQETLQQLDKQRDLDQQIGQVDKAQRALDNLDAMVKGIEREREGACIRAVGNQKVCGCLANNLPVKLTFQQYVLAVTLTKDELGYAQMSPDEKRLVDSIPPIRDRCVGAKAPPKP